MLTYGERQNIKDDRRAKAAEALAALRRRRYPTPCPTCGAGVGEVCLSRTGGRSVRHKDRAK